MSASLHVFLVVYICFFPSIIGVSFIWTLWRYLIGGRLLDFYFASGGLYEYFTLLDFIGWGAQECWAMGLSIFPI